MRTLIVSDIHLGSIRSNAKDLLVFLTKNYKNYDRIILNGDVFNDLEFNRLSAEQWELVSFIHERRNSNDVDLIWIRGNHDEEAMNVVTHLIGIPTIERFDFTENGESFIITHGHLLSSFYKTGVAIQKFFIWMYSFIEIYDKKGKISALIDKIFKDKTKENALSVVKNMTNTWIICGHSHLPEINFPYANCGAWVNEIKTYIEIDSDGTVALREYK